MRKNMKNIITALVVLFTLSACDITIHHYPFTQKIDVTLALSADLTPPSYYCDVIYDARTGQGTLVNTQKTGMSPEDVQEEAPRFTEDALLRFTVDLCTVQGTSYIPVDRRICYTEADTVCPQGYVTFSVEPQEYKVLVWCDYVRKSNKTASWYYDNTDLKNIRFTEETVLDNNDKDAYSTVKMIDLSHYKDLPGEHQDTVNVALNRPLGRYKVIADDINEYVAGGGNPSLISLQVTYRMGVAAGYNVEDQAPNYFESTRTFTTTSSMQEDGSFIMGYDYLFVNGEQSNLLTDLRFIDGQGNEIQSWEGISIPVLRNKETIVRGAFLTKSYGEGGIGIDDRFEGEFDIVIP